MPISNVLPQSAEFVARDWRPVEKNTLRGFLTLEETRSGVLYRDVSLHEKNESRWLAMPARSWSKPDGSNGWNPMVEFRDQVSRSRFMKAAMIAVEKMLAEQGGGGNGLHANQ